MKRDLHRKTKLIVGDYAYASTEIVVRGDGGTIPRGGAGAVKAIKGELFSVFFDSSAEGEMPGGVREVGPLVHRGQVRLRTRRPSGWSTASQSGLETLRKVKQS